MITGVRAVLFDLDGTLIDSAPDLAGTANDMRTARGLQPLPYHSYRALVSNGARGMLAVGLGLVPGDDSFEAARIEFLDRYAARLTQETHVFPEVVPMLATLDSKGVPWGIVTNKMQRFTTPVVAALGLDKRSGAVISGDTTPHAKPHPEPLFEAARRMQVAPEHCVYVGDDLRDIESGKAAGMKTVSAAWGYLGDGGAVEAWQADFVIHRPGELLNLLNLA
ncbi:phosphoglycolate phosphatase [soil metagenome]